MEPKQKPETAFTEALPSQFFENETSQLPSTSSMIPETSICPASVQLPTTTSQQVLNTVPGQHVSPELNVSSSSSTKPLLLTEEECIASEFEEELQSETPVET